MMMYYGNAGVYKQTFTSDNKQKASHKVDSQQIMCVIGILINCKNQWVKFVSKYTYYSYNWDFTHAQMQMLVVGKSLIHVSVL